MCHLSYQNIAYMSQSHTQRTNNAHETEFTSHVQRSATIAVLLIDVCGAAMFDEPVCDGKAAPSDRNYQRRRLRLGKVYPVDEARPRPKVGLVGQGRLHTRQVVVVDSLEEDESGVVDSGQVHVGCL